MDASTPKSSPSTTNTHKKQIELKCAWCYSNERRHSHITSQCRLLHNAGHLERKWNIAQQYKICTVCLGHDHKTDKCSYSSASQCQQCNSVHSQSLGCKPTTTHPIEVAALRPTDSSPPPIKITALSCTYSKQKPTPTKITILQRQKQSQPKHKTTRPTSALSSKPLQQRQKEYAHARAKIFSSCTEEASPKVQDYVTPSNTKPKEVHTSQSPYSPGIDNNNPPPLPPTPSINAAPSLHSSASPHPSHPSTPSVIKAPIIHSPFSPHLSRTSTPTFITTQNLHSSFSPQISHSPALSTITAPDVHTSISPGFSASSTPSVSGAPNQLLDPVLLGQKLLKTVTEQEKFLGCAWFQNLYTDEVQTLPQQRRQVQEKFLGCAWCHSNKLIHNHATQECHLFLFAESPQLQWNVIQQYNICAVCLSNEHETSTCIYRNDSQCQQCNSAHFQDLPCQPTKVTSPVLQSHQPLIPSSSHQADLQFEQQWLEKERFNPQMRKECHSMDHSTLYF